MEWNGRYFSGKNLKKDSKESSSSKSIKKEESSYDAELIQEHGFKYLSWNVQTIFQLMNKPNELEDWYIKNSSVLSRVLVGHYEVVTREEAGIFAAYSRFDYITFPEVIITTASVSDDPSSDDNFGIVEDEIIIPAQIYYFNNYLAGDWIKGQINPMVIEFEIDYKSRSYNFIESRTDWKKGM